VCAFEQLTLAILSEASLQAAEKQEVVRILSTIAEQAAKTRDERSKGILKVAVAWIPIAISAAKNPTTLWERLGPIIRAHLGT
jgi:hypothetical protein